MARLYLTRLIILLLALSGMIFIHFHYVAPQLKARLAEPAANEEAPKAQNAATGSRLALVEFYNSLQRMKKSVPGNSSQLAKAEGRKWRNPFFWPTKVNSPYISSSIMGVAQSGSRMSRSADTVSSSTTPQPLPVLKMTIVGKQRQIALIQNQFRTVGEQVNGDTVKGIGDNFVILTRATGRDVKIIVAQNSGYGVAVEPTGGSAYSPPPARKSSRPQPGAASFMNQQNKVLLQLMQQLKQSR